MPLGKRPTPQNLNPAQQQEQRESRAEKRLRNTAIKYTEASKQFMSVIQQAMNRGGAAAMAARFGTDATELEAAYNIAKSLVELTDPDFPVSDFPT